MAHTTIELHEPEVSGRVARFRWTVDPPSDLYQRTEFRLTFPESIDVSTVPESLWWLVFLLCVHSHWVVMRPCTVKLPVALSERDVALWERLLDTHIATAEAQRDSGQFERSIDLVLGSRPLAATVPLVENGRYAAAFSGGKDSLVQAAMLLELGTSPLLVATTSPMPGLVDHGTRHRRRAFDEIQRRRGATLVEVESDLRSAWDNGGPSRRGFPFGVNEISDTFLYTSVLIAVGYAVGATHLFLASENEVSENHVESGRFLQHPHFMYSAATQAVVRALLEPAGIYYGSLISSLHSNQVQELLTTRYSDLRDLQFSCWRTTEERRACSECSECKRLGWLALSLGEPPTELGIDVLHMLLNYDNPEKASRVHTYPPSAAVSARMHAQTARALARIPVTRLVGLILREHPLALARPSGWRAVRRFVDARSEAGDLGTTPAPGYRAGYLETVDPMLRERVAGIFAAHFTAEPVDAYADQLQNQRQAIARMTSITPPERA